MLWFEILIANGLFGMLMGLLTVWFVCILICDIVLLVELVMNVLFPCMVMFCGLWLMLIWVMFEVFGFICEMRLLCGDVI